MMVPVCKPEWSRYAMHYNRKNIRDRIELVAIVGLERYRGGRQTGLRCTYSYIISTFFQRNIERQHICTTILLVSLWKGGCQETINGLLSPVA